VFIILSSIQADWMLLMARDPILAMIMRGVCRIARA
jgi:hypothetical protein